MSPQDFTDCLLGARHTLARHLAPIPRDEWSRVGVLLVCQGEVHGVCVLTRDDLRDACIEDRWPPELVARLDESPPESSVLVALKDKNVGEVVVGWATFIEGNSWLRGTA